MKDGCGRNIDYLRISVTDKCNLRCRYCMPAEGVERLPHGEILTLEEIARVVRVLSELGIRKVRLTGGEPLVRKNLIKLISDIHRLPGIEEIAMTTNGVVFAQQAAELKEAGLAGVNISLDTLNPHVFRRITGFDLFERVMQAVDAAGEQGLGLKINCVPCEELNGEGAVELARLAKERELDVRYIELMPVGCGKEFHGISSDEMLRRLEAVYGKGVPTAEKRGNGPARYYDFAGFCGKVGFISPMSHKFCRECNRIRLTADGRLKLCLHYEQGLELKPFLRQGASDEEIARAVEEALLHKAAEHDFQHMDVRKDSERKKMVQIGG